jgi:hypothetical protein
LSPGIGASVKVFTSRFVERVKCAESRRRDRGVYMFNRGLRGRLKVRLRFT